jgi:hypothetical protein
MEPDGALPRSQQSVFRILREMDPFPTTWALTMHNHYYFYFDSMRLTQMTKHLGHKNCNQTHVDILVARSNHKLHIHIYYSNYKTDLQLGDMLLEDHKVLDVFQTVLCSSWSHRESRPTYQRLSHEVTSSILFNLHVCLTHTCFAGGLVTLDTRVHSTARVWCFAKRFAKWKVLAPSSS